jgi:hypothetical protein
MINNKSTQEEQDAYFATKTAEFYALISEIESVTGKDLSAGRQNFAESWERNKPGRSITVQNASNWIVAQIEQQQRILVRKQEQKAMFPE